jgi:hypothetical protein
MRSLTLGLFLFFTIAPKAAATRANSEEWPQFLGPTRDGKSSDTRLVTGWLADGLRECWRVPVGEGFAGITTASDVVLERYLSFNQTVTSSRFWIKWKSSMA